jgi:hypothetical protein
LLSIQATANSDASLAFQWAYPIWTQANLRFEQSAAWGIPPGQWLGSPSPAFSMNRLGKKIGHYLFNLNPPLPTVALCNATLCPGVNFQLSPSPVVSPNVDTIYAGGWTDLRQALALNVPDPTTDPNGARYYSVTFYDMYTNVVLTLDNNNYPHGGLFCLVRSAAQLPICQAALGPNAPKFILPGFLSVIARVYSEGRTVNCVDPQTGAIQQGIDGCYTLERTQFVNIGPAPPGGLLAPFSAYLSLMNPVSSSACAYKYPHPPCYGGSNHAFWDAVCKVIVENPPSQAEGDYINAHFASLGIHSTGCSNLAYNALEVGFWEGYATLKVAQSTVGATSPEGSNVWKFLPFTSTWDISQEGLLIRAVTSFRLHAMVPNDKAAYWAIFHESRGTQNRLSCANGARYRVDFRAPAPVNYDNFGFWSVTLYDETWFMVGASSTVFGARGNTKVVPDSFIIAADCNGGPGCVVCPNGPFQLLLRGYQPLADLQPGGDYEFPKIKQCHGEC